MSVKHFIRSILNYAELLFQDLFIRPFLLKKPQYKKMYSIAICAIFKDEGPFLKEWIEFNHMVGVEHFYLYNNNSSDDYSDVLQPYVNEGLVTLIDFPYDQAQIKAYKHFWDLYRAETQWVSFLDIDEFLVPISQNNLKDWLRSYEKFPVIQIYWKMFGTSGLMKHNYQKLTIEQYHVSWKGLYHTGKCFINTDYEIVAFDSMLIHGPCVYLSFLGFKLKLHPFNIFRRSVLGLGLFIEMFVDEDRRSIQINHYWSRAWDVYDGKRRKTDVFFEKNPKSELWYFLAHENQNCSVDYNIYKYIMQVKWRYYHCCTVIPDSI